jgi:hypothetical protein|tara:strand:+ start:2474 stop:2851 length:378 start_codon:yes stop_codon:yes gene_type:complete
MAFAALVDKEGIVIDVLVVDDDNFVDSKGKTISQVGTFPQDELLTEYMLSLGLWVEDGFQEWRFTSYDNEFRGTYAGIGYTYDRALNVFADPNEGAEPNIEVTDEMLAAAEKMRKENKTDIEENK